MKISSPGGGIAVELADVLAGADDLEEIKRALIRETTIRHAMAETGEDRKTVADMIDAMGSMSQEAVLELTEGEPTTLADALSRYVATLEQAAAEDETLGAWDVCGALSALLVYPWPGRCKMPCGACDPETEASWRSRLAQEVYQHADRIEREPQTRSLGVASIVRSVGDKIGKMPS